MKYLSGGYGWFPCLDLYFSWSKRIKDNIVVFSCYVSPKTNNGWSKFCIWIWPWLGYVWRMKVLISFFIAILYFTIYEPVIISLSPGNLFGIILLVKFFKIAFIGLKRSFLTKSNVTVWRTGNRKTIISALKISYKLNVHINQKDYCFYKEIPFLWCLNLRNSTK